MKRFSLMLVLFLALLVWPAQAQEGPTISNLELSLWPEYDQPEVLVIYRGQLAEDTRVPVPIEIRIPAGAGGPSAVAYVTPDGQRFNQQYTTRQEGDWVIVSFGLETRGFQLEYYDDLPVDSTGQREYALVYAADYPITVLSLDVQVPPTARSFVLDPEADSVMQESDGLTYHFVQAGPVSAGDEFLWTLRYQKDNADLTLSSLAQPETAATAAPTLPPEDNSTVWIFLVAFVTLVGFGAGAFWLGRRTQSAPEASSPPLKQHKRRGSGRGAQDRAQQVVRPTGDGTLFCHKCGAQLRAESEFCHKCGTEVRKA